MVKAVSKSDAKQALDKVVAEAAALYPKARHSYGGIKVLSEPRDGVNWKTGVRQVAGLGDAAWFDAALDAVIAAMPVIDRSLPATHQNRK